MALLFDLSDRTKLRVAGNDRVRFLNGQMTNDIRRVTAETWIPACVLTAKGKLDAFVFVTADEHVLWIDADVKLRPTLAPRLERYIIADDVAIEDVTEQFSLFHVVAEMRPNSPKDGWRRARRFGTDGWDLMLPAPEHDPVKQLLGSRFRFCDNDCTEQFRIEQGIPRWARELTPEIIPVEANLESEAIDYAKGCYIGQEVISRMKMSGQSNKRLRGLLSLDNRPLNSRMRLFSENGSDVGWITSAVRSSSLEKEIALGFVKRGSNEPGVELRARSEDESATEVRLEVVALPFDRGKSHP